MDDTFQKVAAAGADVVIIALICFSLFSGKPAFETTVATPAGPPAGDCIH